MDPMREHGRKDIPCLIGRCVTLSELKTSSLNGKTGIVVGWNDIPQERFQVKLFETNSIKLIKPANLMEMNKLENEAIRNFRKFEYSDEVTNFEKGNYLLSLIDQSLSREFYAAKLSWVVSLLNLNEKTNIHIKNQVRVITEDVIKNCNYPDYVVEAKIRLTHSIQSENQTQNVLAREILLECIDNHYRGIPCVGVSVVLSVPESTTDLTIKIASIFHFEAFWRI